MLGTQELLLIFRKTNAPARKEEKTDRVMASKNAGHSTLIQAATINPNITANITWKW
jgi:hypothetical protein